MGRYIEWDDVVNRYPKIADVGGADEVSSAYIVYAEAFVEANLAGWFTVPFSSDNLTAKDLCIDATYAKLLAFRDEKKAKSISDQLSAVIKDLRAGDMAMVTTSGTAMYTAGSGAWSSTQDYHSSFGMHDVRHQLIDVDLIEAEYSERS